MFKKWKPILITGLLVTLTACGQEAEAPGDESQENQEGAEEMNGWQLEVQAVQENEDLKVELQLTNNTDDTQTLEFSSSQAYELVMTDEADEEVYRFSEGMMFTMAIMEEEIEKGDSRTYEESIPLTHIEEGNYTLQAEIAGKTEDNSELPKTTIDVEITK